MYKVDTQDLEQFREALKASKDILYAHVGDKHKSYLKCKKALETINNNYLDIKPEYEQTGDK